VSNFMWCSKMFFVARFAFTSDWWLANVVSHGADRYYCCFLIRSCSSEAEFVPVLVFFLRDSCLQWMINGWRML
jgi:hypothetical protein